MRLTVGGECRDRQTKSWWKSYRFQENFELGLVNSHQKRQGEQWLALLLEFFQFHGCGFRRFHRG